MNEKPIERLQYFNGERLEAGDLTVEQEYHIRVRRWLNKSLYSAGIADGLEVAPDKGNLQRVIVSPGLALDSEGREIILLEETPFPVVGRQSTVDGQVIGNYLTIEYREETRAEEPAGCTPRKNDHSKGQVAWGGPSRIRAMAVLGWSDQFPHESSGKIVLAQVELDHYCNVKNVYTYLRHYIGPASQAAVRQYALEGERHIDVNNPGRIYFHIRGHQPQSVTLYLRAEMFSTLYYTEMGQHNHTINVGLNSLKVPAHLHALPLTTPGATGTGSSHNHTIDSIIADTDEELWKQVLGLIAIPEGIPPLIDNGVSVAGAIARLAQHEDDPNAQGIGRALSVSLRPSISFHADDLKLRANMNITVGGEATHTHPIPGATNNYPADGKDESFPLTVNNSTSLSAGVTDPSPPPPVFQTYTAHPGAPLTHVDNLQVYIGKADPSLPVPIPPNKPPDDKNRTKDILIQLNNSQPNERWLDQNGNGSLGDGGKPISWQRKAPGKSGLIFFPPPLVFLKANTTLN